MNRPYESPLQWWVDDAVYLATGAAIGVSRIF
jgi:hypothetical protein